MTCVWFFFSLYFVSLLVLFLSLLVQFFIELPSGAKCWFKNWQALHLCLLRRLFMPTEIKRICWARTRRPAGHKQWAIVVGVDGDWRRRCTSISTDRRLSTCRCKESSWMGMQPHPSTRWYIRTRYRRSKLSSRIVVGGLGMRSRWRCEFLWFCLASGYWQDCELGFAFSCPQDTERWRPCGLCCSLESGKGSRDGMLCTWAQQFDISLCLLCSGVRLCCVCVWVACMCLFVVLMCMLLCVSMFFPMNRKSQPTTISCLFIDISWMEKTYFRVCISFHHAYYYKTHENANTLTYCTSTRIFMDLHHIDAWWVRSEGEKQSFHDSAASHSNMKTQNWPPSQVSTVPATLVCSCTSWE